MTDSININKHVTFIEIESKAAFGRFSFWMHDENFKVWDLSFMNI